MLGQVLQNTRETAVTPWAWLFCALAPEKRWQPFGRMAGSGL